MSTTKHTTIDQLKKLALRTKSEIGLVDGNYERADDFPVRYDADR